MEPAKMPKKTWADMVDEDEEEIEKQEQQKKARTQDPNNKFAILEEKELLVKK